MKSKILLTPSQVSVLLSSGIVLLFTLALFLSGYAIQQRTLGKLRAAVTQQMAPRPTPRVYLPDRFKKATTELEDGTVIDVEPDDGSGGGGSGGGSNPPDGLLLLSNDERDETYDPAQGAGTRNGGKHAQAVLEIRPSAREEAPGILVPEQQQQQKPLDGGDGEAEGGETSNKDETSASESRDKNSNSNNDRPADTLRTQKEIDQGTVLTTAERRRRIRGEIQRLSQGDEPVYYQRRLW